MPANSPREMTGTRAGRDYHRRPHEQTLLLPAKAHQPVSEPVAPTAHSSLGGRLIAFAMLLVGALPEWLARALAALAAPLLYFATLLRERIVEPRGRGMFRNQRIVFRERWTPAFGRALMWRWARHMTELAVDFCRMPRINASNIDVWVNTRQIELMRPLMAGGRGLISVTGHVGLWEMCGHLWALKGLPITILARPLTDLALEQRINAIRTSGGERVLSKWGSLWSLKSALDRGEAIGIAGDENARDQGVYVPFLGTLASSHTMPAVLHRLTGVPIIVVSCHRLRTRRPRFVLCLWEVIRHTPTADRAADIVAITARVQRAIGRSVLAFPEQWLWGARRYYSRPPGEVAGADGLPPRADSVIKVGGDE